MIWGEEDAALSKQNTHGAERYVADLTLRYMPGNSHSVQQEDPEAVNAILEAWLSGRPIA
jgi:pimeloyl-ACP methyl ester carboxylesterase